MKFTLETSTGINLVRSWSPSQVDVGGRTLRSSFIVTREALVEDWAPRDPSALKAAHLESVLALRPGIVILGTGPRQVFPDPRLLAFMAARGVGFEVMDTGAACRTYNVLVQESRPVAAAFILGGQGV